jgi:peptidylprolyl isomerase
MLKRVKKFGVPCALICTVLLPFNAFAADASKPDQTKQDPAKQDASKQEVQAKKPTKEELFAPASISKLSETYGHLIQKGLENPILKLDFTSVIKGMQDAKNGKAAPMTEQEYEEAINLVQEYAYQDLANKNLQEANAFLKDNAKKSGVKELEAGKLQIMVLQEGKGDTVTEETVPTISYSGKYADGTVFGSSEQSGGPIAISLNSTIPGFRKGVLGMKKGEKRRLFIHPDLGYGMSGQLLPNALLIFDIEVTDVKPKPKEEPKDADADDGDDDDNGEDLAAAERLFPDQFDEEEENYNETSGAEEYRQEMQNQDTNQMGGPTQAVPPPQPEKKQPQ